MPRYRNNYNTDGKQPCMQDAILGMQSYATSSFTLAARAHEYQRKTDSPVGGGGQKADVDVGLNTDPPGFTGDATDLGCSLAQALVGASPPTALAPLTTPSTPTPPGERTPRNGVGGARVFEARLVDAPGWSNAVESLQGARSSIRGGGCALSGPVSAPGSVEPPRAARRALRRRSSRARALRRGGVPVTT